MKKFIIVLLFSVALSGCAIGLSEFRDEYPAFQIAALQSTNYFDLATCVVTGLEQQDRGWRTGLLNIPYEHRASFIATATVPTGPFMFGQRPILELLFVQSDAATVSITARASSYWGGDMVLDAAKGLLPACAKAGS